MSTDDPDGSGSARRAAERASTRAWRVLAPNPGPMTLDGTNTWVLAEPGADRCVVVDPGPDLPEHHASVQAALAGLGLRAEVVLLTHGHADHSAGARTLAEALRAPVRALDPRHRLGSEGLGDGDVIEVAGLEVRVLGTPGHTADSLSFHLPGDHAVLTGDTVLGRGTTVVADPDGRLDDYLASLRRLAALAEVGDADLVLPGHGPWLADARGVVSYYLAHRQARLAAVAEAVAAGAADAAAVVEIVYADVPRELWPAAELSVRAQLRYLRERSSAT